MNVIFLTISRTENIREREIYCDLMRKFKAEGHNVWVVYPRERRFLQQTELSQQIGIQMLGVRTLNIQKTNILEKGLGTILVESQFKRAIKKYFGHIRFDLILYSTPPITFTNVVRYLKQKNPEAVSYLLLKDIFPQNAVDIGIFSKNSLIYKVFRRKEIQLYQASDYIGCMSPANVEFLKKHNDYYPADRVEVAPNSIELAEESIVIDKNAIRQKYGLPTDCPVFIYGGNLGKPQGIDYLIACMDLVKSRKDCFFLIVGSGTDYPKLEQWYKQNKGHNVHVMKGLPKKEYDMLVRSCDVGLIFLDYRFQIPNYPSRLLSYLEYKMPVICATDLNTDIGSIAEQNGYGYSCESRDPNHFLALVDKMLQSDIRQMGERGYQFLKDNYLVEHTYNPIVRHIKS